MGSTLAAEGFAVGGMMTGPHYRIVMLDEEGNRRMTVPCLPAVEAIGYTRQANELAFTTRRVAIAELLTGFSSDPQCQGE